MLSRILFHFELRIALFAVFFASLAPSISHALSAKQGINSFTQEICTTNGEIITIQVVTTKGQQLSTALSAEEEASSRTINNQGYSIVTSHLDKLCQFFDCELHELIKYVPDNAPAV